MSNDSMTLESVLQAEVDLISKGLEGVEKGPKADLLNTHLKKAQGALDMASEGNFDEEGIEAATGILKRTLRRQEARLQSKDLPEADKSDLEAENALLAEIISDLEGMTLPYVSDEEHEELINAIADDAVDASEKKDGVEENSTEDEAPAAGDADNAKTGDDNEVDGQHDEENKETEMDLNDNAEGEATMTEAAALEAPEAGEATAPQDDAVTVEPEVETDVTAGEEADAGDAGDEDETPAGRGDENAFELMIEDKFPGFNKIARNRYGNGETLLITATRNAARNQRKIDSAIPADAIKWAAGADLETKFALMATDPKGGIRVISADITEHLDELKSGAVRFSVNLWDDYGNAKNCSATIGSAKSPIDLDEVKVETWEQE
ncbi:MAG: hypothetical protein ABJN42_10515 [Roseibium sp.]|uniref:hypothetical protein n=1 Tax=Roseibium sp. TaxID=1936156 RepID=UPI00329A6F0C